MSSTPHQPQAARPTPPAHPRILLFTGNGKGKTTAAMGMALRAAGHDLPTRILQFLKADDSTGELAALQAFPHVSLQQVGKGFVPKPDHPRYPCHRTAARHGLELARQAVQGGQYPLIILDEICTAVHLGLLTEQDVADLLQQAPAGLVMVLTGRGAPDTLIALADTVTRMDCIKHGMDVGFPATKGVEC